MDVDDLWTNILGEIELEVSRANFASFFKGTKLSYNTSTKTATIVCPNSASSIMLQNRFSPLIKHQLEKRLLVPVSLEVSVSSTRTTPLDPGPLFTSTSNTDSKVRQSGLNPQYAFDNFAVSETNQMAFAAANAVSSKLASAYNPLFLWGSTGVGKTHLMQAIGRASLVKDPNISVIYCTGEDFTNDIIEAIRARTTTAFKRRFRSVSLLLIDDIQFIAGRESVQMEFFHTFNSILQSGGQIVLTSDMPPSNIPKLESRLRSRFEGGLTIDISPPNFELRTAILLIKARERGSDISLEIAKQLAANIEDVRALEGTLLRFLTEQQHDFDTTKIISKLVGSSKISSAQKKSPQKVLDLVAGEFDLKTSQLVGKSRKKHIVLARHLLMFVLRQELGMSLEEVGMFLGGRDHTTIMHGVEKVATTLPKQEPVRNHLTTIRRLLWEQ